MKKIWWVWIGFGMAVAAAVNAAIMVMVVSIALRYRDAGTTPPVEPPRPIAEADVDAGPKAVDAAPPPRPAGQWRQLEDVVGHPRLVPYGEWARRRGR